jgi:NADPH2:quinone reductase
MARRSWDAMVVEYDRTGDVEVLQVRTRPQNPPGRGEVLVDVVTSGINHIDGFIRGGAEEAFHPEPFPRGSGSDFAGIVAEVGEGVQGFARGAEVIGHVRSGAHATALTVPAAALVHKPRNVTWEVAGGLYLAGATALDTLDQLRVGADDTVVISAAAGGVGSIEAQIARYRGAVVIGTCGERNFDYLRQLGIKPVVYGSGVADRIRKAAGRPVTAMIDNFGQDGRALADELGVPASRYRSSEDRRDTELRLLEDDAESLAKGTALLQGVAQLAEKGAFRLLVSGLYPLADVADAYSDLSRLHSRGKVVLATHPVTSVRTLRARDVWEAAG